VECETRTSPGFTFDNDWRCCSFDTPQCGPIWRFALSRSARHALTDRSAAVKPTLGRGLLVRYQVPTRAAVCAFISRVAVRRGAPSPIAETVAAGAGLFNYRQDDREGCC
jgi:hypothetical protein